MNGLVEPRFELQPVDDDQVRRVKLSHLAGRELKVMRFSPGRQEIFDLRQISGHIDRETPDRKKAGDHLYFARFPARRRAGKPAKKQERQKTKDALPNGKSHGPQYL